MVAMAGIMMTVTVTITMTATMTMMMADVLPPTYAIHMSANEFYTRAPSKHSWRIVEAAELTILLPGEAPAIRNHAVHTNGHQNRC